MSETSTTTASSRTGNTVARAALAVLALIAIVALAYWLVPAAPAVGAGDQVVVGDFDNTAGDAVFDDVLKQALLVQLRQSPFLSFVSDDRVRETLRSLGKSAGDRLNPATARDVCRRQNVKATIAGAVALQGSQYVVTLNATDCATGNGLVSQQSPPVAKEAVLTALGELASSFRAALGEPSGSIQAYNVPIVQAATGSLQAFQSFAAANRLIAEGQNDEAAGQLERAIAADSSFALAYAQLATVAWNQRRLAEARNQAERAFTLRERVTARDRFVIESRYHHAIHGDLDAALAVYRRWSEVYPRDQVPFNNLGVVHVQFGEYDKALAAYTESLRLEPIALTAANIAWALFNAGRVEDARKAADEAMSRFAVTPSAREIRMRVACVQGDMETVTRVLEEGRRAGDERVLHMAYSCATVRGRFDDARALEAGMRAQESRLNPQHQLQHASFIALAEWWLGDRSRARAAVAQAAAAVPDSDVPPQFPALLATVGDHQRATRAIDRLIAETPRSTVLVGAWKPITAAIVALNENRPADALRELQAADRFSAAETEIFLYRGLAHMQAGSPREAAAAFEQAATRWPQRGLTDWVNTFAQVSLARALAAAGDAARGRQTYERFLATWAHADASSSLLLAVRKEVAALR